MFSKDILHSAELLIEICTQKKLTLTVAESCTGGLIGGALTAVAGSSKVFDRGFVTYSNIAKRDVLAVSPDILRTHGAVSVETACAMAEGALRLSGCHVSVAVTGIAGPGGGSPERPVGLVQFATSVKAGATIAHTEQFGEVGRHEVRMNTVAVALKLLLARLG